MSITHPAPPAVTGAEPSDLSLPQRALAIFSRPAAAWSGLDRRVGWWFPMAILVVCNVIFTVTLHERAILPMITAQWEAMVDSGQMPAERLEATEAFMRSPAGLGMTAGQQVIVWPIIQMLLALAVTFGAGFVLGRKLPFRLAFEVVNWSSLVLLPSYAITWVLAWTRESLMGIHLGLAALIPASETPGKLEKGLTTFLDAIGPFNIWYVAVIVIGAAVLTGAPRKQVAWVLGGLFVALAIFGAAMAALFTPAA